MKNALRSLAKDLESWIADQDENLVELPVTAKTDSLTQNIDSVEDLKAETEKNQAISLAEDKLDDTENQRMRTPTKKMLLDALKEQVISCEKCPLGKSRLNAVFGVGSANARLMFVGEGPGFQEDHQGEPFVGRSGQLLDKIMETVLGLNRADVYIANIVKCHPMKNPETPEAHLNDRPPSSEETDACKDYLLEQIRIIQPVCIVPLGSVAAKFLLQSKEGISVLRGKVYEYNASGISSPIKIVPTYHPAALLRNPNLKRDTWYDIKLVKSILDSAMQ